MALGDLADDGPLLFFSCYEGFRGGPFIASGDVDEERRRLPPPMEISFERGLSMLTPESASDLEELLEAIRGRRRELVAIGNADSDEGSPAELARGRVLVFAPADAGGLFVAGSS